MARVWTFEKNKVQHNTTSVREFLVAGGTLRKCVDSDAKYPLCMAPSRAVHRGQQGAGHGEAVHVLRPACATPVAALAQSAHGLQRPQAAPAPLPSGQTK